MTQRDQISALIESWTSSQQQIWENWMETLQKSGGSGDAKETMHKGLERWQESVDHTLDAQSKAMTAWASQVGSIEGAPAESAKWADEGAKMVAQWSDAQRSLWHQWFGMMGKAMESGGAQPGADQMKQLMAGWEQVGKQMETLQKTWATKVQPDKK